MVGERAHKGHRCLLAPCSHPCEPQGQVVLQAVSGGTEGVRRPVLRDMDGDVVHVPRGVSAVLRYCCLPEWRVNTGEKPVSQVGQRGRSKEEVSQD